MTDRRKRTGDKQEALFDAPPAEPAPPAAPVRGADAAQWRTLAERLPAGVRLGTSSWGFPGWRGLVWADAHDASALARRGLPAYASHPLLRAVSLDRSFWRAPDVATYRSLAAQVPEDFRFLVKAPASVTDCAVRNAGGPVRANPSFLDPDLAVGSFVQPALDGLGARAGALVFQLSPIGRTAPARIDALLERLDAMLAGCRRAARDATLAVEVRDGALLGPALAAVLKRHGARYCLGLHDRLPPIGQQLPMLRALWPGPLVVRWSLQSGLRYGAAKDRFAPFDRLAAPDPATRDELARLVAATVQAGETALVAINNKAEGSAPLSVFALAEAIAGRLEATRPEP